MIGQKSTNAPSTTTYYATVALPSGSVCGGHVTVTFTATDGTTKAVGTGSFTYSAFRTSGIGAVINGLAEPNAVNLTLNDVVHGDGPDGYRGDLHFSIIGDAGNNVLKFGAFISPAEFTPTSGTIYWEVNEATGATVTGL